MVSSVGYVARPHNYQTHTQSNTQYLKEAYGLSASPTPQTGMSNENEWPSLTNATLYSIDPHDRAMSQQRNIGRRATNQLTLNPQLSRRPASIGRIGLQQDAARAIGPMQQMNMTNQQQKQAQQVVNNGAAKNPKLYKTELCRSWADSGHCNYGERCQYAHGDAEKRPIPRHPKYKSEACKSYHQSGYCAYGARCHFIHNEDAHVLAQMVAANAAVSTPQLGQSPTRPSNLFTGSAAVGICSSPTNGSKSGTPVSLGPIGPSNANPNAIARVASLAASAYNQNPNFFSHQFQTQLQIFNDSNLKTPPQLNNSTPIQAIGEMGSTGDSPIPSSNDSGAASPACPCSPGSDQDEPNFFFVHKQSKSAGTKHTSMPFNLLPSSLNSDFESGFSSSSSTSSNVGTKPLNSPIIGSPPANITTSIWSSGSVGTPTYSVSRLPVFERLSNGP